MLSWLCFVNEDPSRISCSQDLRSPHSAALAKRFNIRIDDIAQLNEDLAKEIKKSGATLRIDLADPKTQLNAHVLYMKKFACAAIIPYELLHREKIVLPFGRGSKTYARCRDIAYYRRVAEKNGNFIDEIALMQRKSLDRLLND